MIAYVRVSKSGFAARILRQTFALNRFLMEEILDREGLTGK